LLTFEELRKAKEGDPKSIEKLCLNTWEPIYRFIYYKVQNREEAEDITQETYVELLSTLSDLKLPVENIIGYLKVVALNILRDKWRKKKHRGIVLDLEEINPLHMADKDQQDQIAQRLLLEAALAKLKDDQRQVLELRIINGYSVADTAKIIGKSEGAVRTAQHRALQALAKLLEGKLD